MYFRPESQGTYSRLWMVALTEAVTVQWGGGDTVNEQDRDPCKNPQERAISEEERERDGRREEKRKALLSLFQRRT